jgi:hypothetical protein
MSTEADSSLDGSRVELEEMLEIYDLSGSNRGFMSRENYYSMIQAEFQADGKITTQVKGVRLMLLHTDGCIYVQRRSTKKRVNPGLYDKAVGGHVTAKDDHHPDPVMGDFDVAMSKESNGEIGVKIRIVAPEDYVAELKKADLETEAVCMAIDTISPWKVERIIVDPILGPNPVSIIQPWMNRFYIGYYDGGIQFKDGEAQGIQLYKPHDLADELRLIPKKFTADIADMYNRFSEFFMPLEVCISRHEQGGRK